MLLEGLITLSRVRLVYVSLAAIIYMLYPRFATWRINSIHYSTLSFGYDMSVTMEIDVGVTVYVRTVLQLQRRGCSNIFTYRIEIFLGQRCTTPA